MRQQSLELLQQSFLLKQMDVGAFQKLSAGPMHFVINRYEISGVGNLSIMQGAAMLGLMKMDTVILTPTLRDAPLFSYDRIHAMGNDTLIMELYDTMLDASQAAYQTHLAALEAIKTANAALPEHSLGRHWYDSIRLSQSVSKKGKGITKALDVLYLLFLQEYSNLLKDAPLSNREEKVAKTAYYVDGLLKNGGPSTDAFVKSIGLEKTKHLFTEILFAC